MNNNIVSFNASVSAMGPKINTTKASSNIVNITLTNANLKKQKETAGASDSAVKGMEFIKEAMVKEYTFEELLAAEAEKEADLKKNSLGSMSLDEILAEGRETQAEIIAERNRKAIEEVNDLIDSIGEVTLDSEEDIKKAAEAFFNLTDEQKALMDPADLQKLIDADKKLVELKYERDLNAANKVKDLIKSIGTVNLNSEDAIVKAAEAYSKLTDEQKALMDPADLQKLMDAAEQLEKLQKAEIEKKKKELEKLYQARDDNNGFFHPKKEKEIEAKILKLEKELGVPHKPDGWESFCNAVEDTCATVCTFAASAIEGFLDVGEGVVDSLIYAAGKGGELFGIDNQWAEDAIAYDVSGNAYDAWVQASGIDPEIAYGAAHSAGNFVGEMVGYYALSSVPYVGTALAMQGGAGKAIEESINTQRATGDGEVNEWKVFGAGALGALEGYAFGKSAQAAKAGIQAVAKTGVKETFKQTLGSVSKESIKATIKQSGSIAKYTALQTVKDSDLYIETASVLADDIMSGIETGEWDWQRMLAETGTVVVENYAANLTAGIWQANSNINADMRKTAEQNYRNHSGDFSNKPDYYADLAYVEGQSSYSYKNEDGIWVGQDTRISRDDPGITRCLTADRVSGWNAEVDMYPGTSVGTTRVHVGNTNASVFDSKIVGSAADGFSGTTFGIPDDYNFASLGNTDVDGLLTRTGGGNAVHQFQTDLGLPTTDAERVFLYDYDIPRNAAEMPTGRELGSNSQRLPGGRTPNGELELVHESMSIDSSVASSSNVTVLDSQGNIKYQGTLQALRDMKSDPKTIKDYYEIIGGII